MALSATQINVVRLLANQRLSSKHHFENPLEQIMMMKTKPARTVTIFTNRLHELLKRTAGTVRYETE